MAFHGSEVYDEGDFFQQYSQKRSRSNAPNEILEYPIFKELAGMIEGKDILELGCGEGAYALELLEAGAQSYHGMDGSSRMIAAAQQKLAGHTVHLEQISLENFAFSPSRYDLIVSRLVFHYLADLEAVLVGIYRALRPGGTFVLSVEHPVITSCYKAYHNNNKRGEWIVDDYFVPGARTNIWLEKEVIKYHRTISEYFSLFTAAGFQLLDLQESKPRAALFADSQELERRSRIPLFLLMKWGK